MATIHYVSNEQAGLEMRYSRSQTMIDRQERRYNELCDETPARPRSKIETIARDTFNRIRNTRIRTESLAAVRRLRERGRTDNISILESIEQFQHPSRTMEDVVMASPAFRRRYQQRRLEGYANTYRKHDEWGNGIKHTHPLYRVINNEVAIKEDNGEVWAYQYTLSNEERTSMTNEERTDARQTWERGIELLWDNMEDPTSQYNALL